MPGGGLARLRVRSGTCAGPAPGSRASQAEHRAHRRRRPRLRRDGRAGFATDIPTPHIDAIARSGVRFTQGYVSARSAVRPGPACMTGRYQQRFGHEFNPGPTAKADAASGLPRTEATLAERLQGAGYATGMVGKWHLGYSPEKYHPTEARLRRVLRLPRRRALRTCPAEEARRDVPRARRPSTEKEYLTDAFAREAVAFIDQHQAEPFFLYLRLQRGPHAAAGDGEVPRPLRRASRTRSAGPTPPCCRPWTRRSAACWGSCAELKLQRAARSIVFISDNGGPTPTTIVAQRPASRLQGPGVGGRHPRAVPGAVDRTPAGRPACTTSR